MIYEPVYYPFYANGFENLPSQNTPVTADVLNGFEETIKHIEEFLANVDFDNIKKTIVEELPSVEEADSNTIYMIYVESVTGSDKYEQYMLIDGALVMIGDTSVDLTDYAKKEEVEKNKGDIAAIKKDVADLQNAEDITQTTDSTLTNSYDGGIKIDRIAGAVEQNGIPTLEEEVEIQNADFTEINTVSNNLYDVSKDTNRTNVGVTATIGADQTMTLNGIATGAGALPSVNRDTHKFKAKVGDVITLSAKILSGSATVASNTALAYMNIFVDGEALSGVFNGDILAPQGVINANTKITATQNFTVTENMFSSDGYIYLSSQTYVRSGDVYNNLVLVRQIEINSVATEYEPHKESTASIAFTGRAIEVTADDDYTYEKDGKYYVADTIEKTDTGYQLVQRIGEGVFDGSSDENWWKSGGNTAVDEFTLVLDGFKSPYSNMICSHFIYDRVSNKTGTFRNYYSAAWTYPHQVYFMFSKYGTTTIEAFKEWISSNPITIHYILAEPITTTLSDEEIIALLSLKSFDTVTHVSTDSNLQPVIDFEYGTSKVGGYTLDALNTAKRSEIKENANADRLTALEALTTEVTTETEEN